MLGSIMSGFHLTLMLDVVDAEVDADFAWNTLVKALCRRFWPT